MAAINLALMDDVVLITRIWLGTSTIFRQVSQSLESVGLVLKTKNMPVIQ